MRAVATVIMNRANIPYGEFSRISQGGNVMNILLQEKQFVCMQTSVGGVYNPQNVTNMNPTDEQYSIVDWALGGGRLAAADRKSTRLNSSHSDRSRMPSSA